MNEHNIVGKSSVMQSVFNMIERLAKSDSSVLIYGETGTGKELVAKAIHAASSRHNRQLVVINCAGLDGHLLESELFGHKKGSFTGAYNHKLGLLEVADGGTVFLDEIATMPLSTQAKILRFMEDRTIRPVGSIETIKVNVRVISASNEELQKKVKEQAFREDLFFRISTLPISLPPLRDRKDDIPPLVEHFLAELHCDLPIADECLTGMRYYRWPGNIRELRSAIEFASVMAKDEKVIQPRHLPEVIFQYFQHDEGDDESCDKEKAVKYLVSKALRQGSNVYPTLRDEIERELYRQVIKLSLGNKRKAARILGVSPPTMFAKLMAYGLITEKNEKRPTMVYKENVLNFHHESAELSAIG